MMMKTTEPDGITDGRGEVVVELQMQDTHLVFFLFSRTFHEERSLYDDISHHCLFLLMLRSCCGTQDVFMPPSFTLASTDGLFYVCFLSAH